MSGSGTATYQVDTHAYCPECDDDHDTEATIDPETRTTTWTCHRCGAHCREEWPPT